MKKNLLFALLILVLPTQCFTQENFLDTIWSGGIMRTFRVYVPAMYDAQTPTPLIFNFHGSGGNAVNFESATKFRSVADTANFILITPNGTVDPVYPQFGQIWNNFTCCSPVDDVLFVSNMIDSLSATYNIDPTRIYSAGYSNGGFMGYDLACKLSHRIAAVASVAGTMITSRITSCSPSRVVPILEIHGTLDGNVPFNGGAIDITGDTLASVPAVLTFWANFNQCDAPPPTITNLPNTNTTDGSSVQRHIYPNCGDGSAVELLKVVLGGHTWPGLPGGNTNRDIIADEEIWHFFSKHNLNGTVGTTDKPKESTWSVFPNPANDLLHVVLPEGTGKTVIRIMDILGNTVLQQSTSDLASGQINLDASGLTNGIYFLEIQDGIQKRPAQKLLISRQ
jgi:polyhydroxybutyrate depolymerase